MNCSGRLVAVKSSVTEIEDVFEAKIASFFTTPSSEAYIFFFSSTFSMIASIIMSQSARYALLVVPLRRARTASFCCGVIPPFSTGRSANLAKDFSIPAKPLSRNFCSTSSTVTSNPAVAQTCAMPEPINPQPRTPTFLISMIDASTCRMGWMILRSCCKLPLCKTVCRHQKKPRAEGDKRWRRW